MDCHNRPTHIFQLPERSIDQAMFAGDISPTLPYAKQQGVELLKATYTSRDEAARRIPAEFENYYKSKYPQVFDQRHNDLVQAAKKVLAIYQRNVFPEMNITWGTYPTTSGIPTTPAVSAVTTSCTPSGMRKRLHKTAPRATTW